MDTKSRAWCFTINNFNQDEFTTLKDGIPNWMGYLVFQHERGSEGTDHLQGYLECNQRTRLQRLRTYLPRAHFEVRRGTQDQAIDYCKKEEGRIDGPWEHGSRMESRQGKRTDLDDLAERLYAGTDLETLKAEYPGHVLRYRRAIHDEKRDQRAETWSRRSRDLQVYIYWGDAGAGKTRSVYESEGYDRIFTLNTASNGNVWFDGYCGEPVLLIDDFRGWIKFNELLKILDRYPYRLPIKGSFDYASWRRVYLTSNHDPETWYNQESGHSYPALRRRVTAVVHFSTDHPWCIGDPLRGVVPFGDSVDDDPPADLGSDDPEQPDQNE